MEEVKAYKSNDGLVFTEKEKCLEHELKHEVGAKFLSKIESDGFEYSREDYIKLSDLAVNCVIDSHKSVVAYFKEVGII